MALQTTGPIKLSEVNVELGQSSTATFSMNSAASRGLAGKSSGIIKMSDYYGKSTFSYTRLESAASQWNEDITSSGITKCWYRYDLGTSSQSRTVVWQGVQFGGDYSGLYANDAGASGATYAPSAFFKRIHHRSGAYDEGFWHMILELTVPAGQRYIDFYTVNTMFLEYVGGNGYDILGTPTLVTNGYRLYTPGLYVMSGALTYRYAGTAGYSNNPGIVAPATATGKNGRMVFATAVGDWVTYCPITPYTDRFLPQYMGVAMKYDSTAVGATTFNSGASASAISIVSYDIG
jgi:hypothetical protein